jgi:transposase-like protein
MNPRALFCPNDACPSRGVVGKGNITIHSQKQQRYKCTTCGKTFSASKGTAFYRVHQKSLFVIVSTLLAFGTPPQAIVAAFGLDERTVYDWMERAGGHCQQVHEHLLTEQPCDLKQVGAGDLRADPPVAGWCPERQPG